MSATNPMQKEIVTMPLAASAALRELRLMGLSSSW
jgi:hypothetical protein